MYAFESLYVIFIECTFDWICLCLDMSVLYLYMCECIWMYVYEWLCMCVNVWLQMVILSVKDDVFIVCVDLNVLLIDCIFIYIIYVYYIILVIWVLWWCFHCLCRFECNFNWLYIYIYYICIWYNTSNLSVMMMLSLFFVYLNVLLIDCILYNTSNFEC